MASFSRVIPFRKLALVLGMIRFSHTVFALPFALLAMVWAAGGWPTWRVLGWILVAMVGARSAAMTFNRIADRRFDRENPRTLRWPLSTGEVGLPFAWGFLVVNVGLLALAAWMLNPLCLALSPVALAFLLGYSLTKRFTWLCHAVLGFTDGLAPLGAWVALKGRFDPPAWWLCAAVSAWVAGFDLLYALQDLEFDRAKGLKSFPARFGVVPTLWASGLMHLAAAGCYAGAAWSFGAGPVFWAGVALSSILLAVEHSLVRPADLSRLNAAFFTLNGYVSVGLLAFGLLDLAIK
jgi:4-hydroxybenzoate polyprenyltransferase